MTSLPCRAVFHVCSDFVTVNHFCANYHLDTATLLAIIAADSLFAADHMARIRGRALVDRILQYLEGAESREAELWYTTDYRVAWLTLKYAFAGIPEPYTRACYQVSGHRNLAEIVEAKVSQLRKELSCPELIEQFKRDYRPPKIGPKSAKGERIELSATSRR